MVYFEEPDVGLVAADETVHNEELSSKQRRGTQQPPVATGAATVRLPQPRPFEFVELDDLDVLGADAGLRVDLGGARLGHVVADHLDHRVLLERRRVVRRHRLGRDVDRARDAVLRRELVGAQHRGGGAARRRLGGTEDAATTRGASGISGSLSWRSAKPRI